MVVDLGGGSTEAAVVFDERHCLCRIRACWRSPVDEAIMAYIRRKYNLIVGEPTAEEIKIKIGAALPLDVPLEMQVQGRDQVVCRTITITSGEVSEAIAEPLSAMVNVVRAVLAKTPPELSSDIIDRGGVDRWGCVVAENGYLVDKRDGCPSLCG